jgi:arylsulfatase A-like enzyme
VGDHSFPADEHGVHFNGLGAYEESFRTAFALLWPGHVPPELDRTRTASQIDVAPTIADLAGVAHTTHFVGRSLVAGGGGALDPPAPMVQPYDGVRLVAVRWPYKLERHEAAGQEHLYDLHDDPDEERDRIDDPTLGSEQAALREAIGRIRTSQTIIAQKRIWPPASARP